MFVYIVTLLNEQTRRELVEIAGAFSTRDKAKQWLSEYGYLPLDPYWYHNPTAIKQPYALLSVQEIDNPFAPVLG